MKTVGFLCKIGFHSWNGCMCRSCGEFYKEKGEWAGHIWEGCICRTCRCHKRIEDSGHDFDECHCRKCGQILKEAIHDWDGCICRRCKLLRSDGKEIHYWHGCTCRQCGVRKPGEVIEAEHDWDGCVCKKCGDTRTWHIHDLERCICKKCKAEFHDYEYRGEGACPQCRNCYHIFHSWGEDHFSIDYTSPCGGGNGSTTRTCMNCGETETTY